jgi:hypothetical protein
LKAKKGHVSQSGSRSLVAGRRLVHSGCDFNVRYDFV